MSRMAAPYSQEVETPKTPTALMEEPSDQVVFRWRRLTIVVGLVDMHASSGSIMSHLEHMRERIAEDARRAFEKASGTKTTVAKKTTKTNSVLNAEATEVGRPLPRSTTGKWIFDPSQCHHTQLAPRGNKNLLWFTCLTCGSRWERVVPQAAATEPQAPSREAAPPASAVAAPGSVAKQTPALSATKLKHLKDRVSDLENSLVDKKTVTFTDSNQKRKTEDFQMVGFSPLGQRVYERYQELAKNTEVPHEVIFQKLMSYAQTQEEMAGVMEVIQSLKGS